MGQEASYQRVALHKLQQVTMNTPQATVFFDYGLSEEDEEALGNTVTMLESGGPSLYIGKAWHGLHFLLTGSEDVVNSSIASPLDKVVLGGVEIEQETTDGHMRMLTAEEVQEISTALRSISRTELYTRLDASAFNAADIYPAYDQWKPGEMEWLLEDYDKLVQFFHAAAECKEVMLLSIN